ncbi:hypothetical protein ODY45_00150 [Aerococcus urinae]|nr:hypothetical protein [Aerococcus urinae]MCY3057605.1 hypothetical protein [Aerococcus urinae]
MTVSPGILAVSAALMVTSPVLGSTVTGISLPPTLTVLSGS